MRLYCVSIAFLVLVGSSGFLACAESARDSLESARQELAASRYDEAVQAADAGLAMDGDDVTRWGLELVKLEALARAGRSEEVVIQLQNIATARPQNVPATQYSATADQLRAAGEGAAAIQVLDLGLKRFPEDANLANLIEEARSAPAAGSDELEMLRSLGYVE